MLTSTRMENSYDLVFLATVTSVDEAVVVVDVAVVVDVDVAVELVVVVAVEGADRMNVAAVDSDAEAHCVVQSKVSENNLDVEALRTKRPSLKHLHDMTLL